MFWCDWPRNPVLLFCCTNSAALKDSVVDPQEGPPCQRKDALSTSTSPTRPSSYYIQQCELYFDSIQSLPFTPKDQRNKFPRYAKNVARWEWSPWLMLTSFGRRNLISIDKMIRWYPCVCIDRHYRVYPTQPYVRCLVTLFYGTETSKRELGLHIYEEFTFNDHGEMTFIEAWLCEEGLQLGALDDESWPVDQDAINRLSTLLPGLGSEYGEVDVKSKAFLQACQVHPEVEDYRQRVKSFYSAIVRELVQDMMSEKDNFLGFPSKKSPSSSSSRLRSRSKSTDSTAASSTMHISPYPFNGHVLQRVPFTESLDEQKEDEEINTGSVIRDEELKEADPDFQVHHYGRSRFHTLRDSREFYRSLQQTPLPRPSSDFQEVPNEDWLEWETEARLQQQMQIVKGIDSEPTSLYSPNENII